MLQFGVKIPFWKIEPRGCIEADTVSHGFQNTPYLRKTFDWTDYLPNICLRNYWMPLTVKIPMYVFIAVKLFANNKPVFWHFNEVGSERGRLIFAKYDLFWLISFMQSLSQFW